MISRVVASKCGIPKAFTCAKPSLGIGLGRCVCGSGGGVLVVLNSRIVGDAVAPRVHFLMARPLKPLNILIVSPDTDLICINRISEELMVA